MYEDKTWDITITIRAATYCGWKPEHEDITEWLEKGGDLKLLSVDEVKEVS
jgi:hypothetical protein